MYDENEKSKIKVTIEVEVSNSDLSSILCSAIEGGINYWCDEYRLLEGKKSDYGVEYTYDALLVGAKLEFITTEENEKVILTKERLLEGLVKFIADGGSCTDNGVVDASYIDAGDADSIIQYALFNEILYS